MKIIGVIPARYKSTRFEGKPLADIHGRPMLWWVHHHVSLVSGFDEVYIATDDDRIVEQCEKYGLQYVKTSSDHPEHISRIWEVSNKIDSDLYVCVNGDEPMLQTDTIAKIIPKGVVRNEPYVGGLCRLLTDPVEVIDGSNIKIVTNEVGQAIYMSRSPIPYPKGTLLFQYKKYVGVECFNKMALDFFVNEKKGLIENIEDIDHLRFIENGIKIKFTLVESNSLSVDTKLDLEKVIILMKEEAFLKGVRNAD